MTNNAVMIGILVADVDLDFSPRDTHGWPSTYSYLITGRLAASGPALFKFSDLTGTVDLASINWAP